MVRIFALHGWGRLPVDLYWPSLVTALEATGATVVRSTLACEDGDIQKHIAHLASAVGTPDEKTYFIGQSVGNQVEVLRRITEIYIDPVRVQGHCTLSCPIVV